MTNQADGSLSAPVLGELLLMQSVLSNLPDEKTIFSFVCHGLRDVPGVETVTFERDGGGADESRVRMPLNVGNRVAGYLLFTVSSQIAFQPYEDFLKNFCFMLAVILEERNQRRAIERHLGETNEQRIRAEQALAALQVKEAALQAAAQQAEAANKELEAFSYSVSHDLRAPLRHVSGFIQLLASEAQAASDEKIIRYAGIISAAADKMGRLIDDLLSFSRAGRETMQVGSVSLDELVAACRADLEPEMKGRAIEWEVGELPQVKADQRLLRQVFANLLDNAVKYTRQRQVAKISVSARREKNEVVVCVRDNGAGFDMKYADKLFGVFQRLHGEDEFEGTGIGLANVHRIIARHGGRVWAESQVDKGAAFYFSLPL